MSENGVQFVSAGDFKTIQHAYDITGRHGETVNPVADTDVEPTVMEQVTREQPTVLLKMLDKIFALPIFKGTEDEHAINITNLRKPDRSFILAHDEQGLRNTSIGTSGITFINGEQGILRYRGYDIKDLAEHNSFGQVAYLLFNDELVKPDDAKLAAFENEIKKGMDLQPDLIRRVLNAPASVHPMNVLSGAIASLEPASGDEPKDIAKHAAKLVGQTLAIVALMNRRSNGAIRPQDPVVVDMSKGVVENFVNQMYADAKIKQFENEGTYDLVKDTINKLLILHADHEKNCSTFTGQVVASSGAGPYPSVAAATNALYGPLHGGANQAVIKQLDKIETLGGDVQNKVDAVIEAIKADEDIKKAQKQGNRQGETANNLENLVGNPRLMGFGHRVYGAYDPRADVIKDVAKNILDQMNLDPKLKEFLQLSTKLDDEARQTYASYGKPLNPNVDFYSGILYKALGIKPEIFTPMFAAGRAIGWLSHMKEQGGGDIIRPRQVYTGATERAVPAETYIAA